ncbi:chromosome segregation protein SMC [Bowmanella sp. JS7-9]|uniref:Chromosome partition protein Smc n=1 Tax=Pseudobowmanella zhangzhouensis TaxID=1537679 RepID=A0ABW1XH28_9ALTE|nr:chromosome segregation protein SMC [Bowmanella sp. JS7-9]TBX25708.1 hypothetical protein TK45_03180 [Bowmanella sp. JS7-9]
MRLKKIRLAGFKSFVDPTNIPFPDAMTAIVGPNGCGKSNVIDAVRWVLGESSAKNLRGDAMTDVIFNGSSARKPVGQCSVELVFENVSERLQGEYAKYNELSIKRLVTRDATSTYFLNGSKCRRRDVTDLFLGTGLGPRSYAIIEQGMISRLIESKPQDLRIFIEEAAGISRYKERRRETENRIRHTQENLERLQDVRGELAQQLEKLQRQASAAQKYKTLKAQERQLKAELAALRWLKHSQQADSLQKHVDELEVDLQALMQQQRGDESGLLIKQQQRDDLRTQSEQLQQRYFKLGTDITRVEQNQHHNKARIGQIGAELQQILQQQAELALQREQNEVQRSELQLQIEELEPEFMLLQESLQEQQSLLEAEEQKLREQRHVWNEHLKQQRALQQQHHQVSSKVDSLQLMLQRSETTLHSMQSQLQQLPETNQDEVNRLAEQLREAEQELADTSMQLQNTLEQKKTEQTQLLQCRDVLKDTDKQLAVMEAQLASLLALQQLEADNVAYQAYLSDNTQSWQPLWQYLSVEPTWQLAVETVLGKWLQAPVFNQQAEFADVSGAIALFSENFVQHKASGSLAERVSSDSCPHWLNMVLCAEDEVSAKQISLLPGQSVITPDGYWRGTDWAIRCEVASEQTVLVRATLIEQVQREIAQQNARKSELDERVQALDAACEELIKGAQQLDEAREVLRHRVLESKQQFLQAEQAQLQRDNQQQALQQQIQDLQLHIETEREELLLAKAQSEDSAEQLAQADSQVSQMQDSQQQIDLAINQQRQRVEQLRNDSHRLALSRQQQQSQYQQCEQQLTRMADMLTALDEREAMLVEERESLQLPLEDNQEQLQLWLTERVDIEQQKNICQQQLEDIELWLADCYKGQQQVAAKAAKIKAEQASIRLEIEGQRVRANALIEQLDEMRQNLKFVLDNLSDDAEENQWQKQLDQVGMQLARLGAVNLTAVEEYELQAQRKAHLDEQFDDLTSALDTLQTAIRKIDRETRARFKETFDSVNQDLQHLFPKVFGGGAAYLALTDDDLLETGVTIMAQPPGKKNSTIHLLSGGEKALTALSLVFAIFRLNPAPFCLLDEVDAPLDDANVVRFCKLVSEMSDSVQFIYITHNKIAMEMATHLTGVTMAEPGVSRMVAVDVEQAVALAEA